ILPGSSISEVYRDTHPELENAVAVAEKLRNRALAELAKDNGDPTRGAIVANASLHPRPLTVVLRGTSAGPLVAPDGEPLPTQPVAEGLLVHVPGRTVPGLGWMSLNVLEESRGDSPGQVMPGVRVVEQNDG